MIQSYLSHEYGDICGIRLAGTIDSAQLNEVALSCTELFGMERPFIIINLTETESLSGAVIGELLEWRHRFAQRYHGDLVFAGAAHALDKTIRDLGIDKIIELFPDEESAVNYLYWEYKGLTENILLTLPNQIAVVPAVRNLIRKCVLAKNYSTREAFQIETIVDELCNNAVEHGAHGVEGVIEVALSIGRNKIEINIANGIEFINGEGRSPEAITRVMENFRDQPSDSIDNPRGRGLALVRMLANEFDIDSSEDGTCVHVTKYREV